MILARFDDFSDGLWIVGESAPSNEQAGFAVPPGALLQADNIDYLPSGAVRGRRGSRKDNPAAQRSGSILFLRRFYQQLKSGSKVQVKEGDAFDDDGFGTIVWFTPEGAVDPSDGQDARLNLIGGTTGHNLVREGAFQLSPVPADATVMGVAVVVVYRQALDVFPFETAQVRLFENGAVIGAAPANENLGVPYATDLSHHALLFGGTTDLWGLGATLNPARVNGATFGAAFSALQPGGGGANSLFVPFVGVWVYYTAADDTLFIVGSVSGTDIVYETLAGGTFSTITGGTFPTPGRRPHSVHWAEKDKVFIFDGVNPAKEYNGTLMQDIPTDAAVGVAPPTGPYVALHKARLFVTHPGELGHSVYGSTINNERSWPPSYHLNVDDPRGGLITGLASFGDYLLIFKDTCIFRVLGDIEYGPQLQRFEPIHGCIAPDTIQVTPRGVMYLARTGLRITDGETTRNLSEAITPLFVERTTETLYANAVGVYFARREQYWLKLDPADAEGYVLQHISYPTEEGQAVKSPWSRIPAIAMNVAEVWSGGTDDGELYIGDTAGWVWEWDTGSQDDGGDYNVELVTLRRQIDTRTRKDGRVNIVRPMYRGPNTITLGVRYDQATSDDVSVTTGAVVGTPEFREPGDFVTDMANFGRYFAFHVVAAGGPEFELHQIGADLRLRSRRRWV